MKRWLLLFGSEGSRLACSVIYAACAGLLGDMDIGMLLVGDDARRQAGLAAALHADYERISRLMASVPGTPAGFGARLTLRLWPDADAAQPALADLAAENDASALLARALFTPDKLTLPPEAWQNHADVAAVMMEGLLRGENGGALQDVLEEIRCACDAGEDARVVLCGHMADGMTASGMNAVMRALRTRLAVHPPHMTAVMLLPYAHGDNENTAAARAAMIRCGMNPLCDSACALGLAESDWARDGGGAHLLHWLAALCVADAMRRPTPACGLRVWRVAPGNLGWDSMGGEESRRAFGGLMKTASAFHATLAPALRRGLSEPRWLRDRMLGWYTSYFAGVRQLSADERSGMIAQVDAFDRLMQAYAAWCGEILRALPEVMCHADAIEADRAAAMEHYRRVTEISAQIVVLRQEAEDSGLAQEKIVHRHDMEDTDAERFHADMQRMEEQRDQLIAQQEVLNNAIGGAALCRMLRAFRASLMAEAQYIHGQVGEALRRIGEAEKIAAPQEQHRILTARTRMQRMVRYAAQVDAQLVIVERDLSRAQLPENRVRPPQLSLAAGDAAECLFPREAVAMLLELPPVTEPDKQQRRLQAALEACWPSMVLPPRPDACDMDQLLGRLRQSADADGSPLAALLRDLMNLIMEEV